MTTIDLNMDVNTWWENGKRVKVKQFGTPNKNPSETPKQYSPTVSTHLLLKYLIFVVNTNSR